MKSFLIINPFGIGDVLFSTPLIRNISESLPGSKIFYLCNRRVLGVLANHPSISKYFVYERDEFEALRRRSKIAWLKKGLNFIKAIKKENIDTVLDLSLNPQFGFLSLASGIKTRVGYNYKNRGRFLTKKIKFSGYKHKHVIEYYLDLLKFIGVEPEHKKIEIFLKDQQRKADSTIVIAPAGGASWGKEASWKHWSKEKFAKLADRLIDDLGRRVILSGSEQEKAIVDEVASLMHNQPDKAVGLELVEFLNLLSKARVLVANDGGPIHMAVGLGVRTVSIFGPVSDLVYGPYPPDSKKHIVFKKDLPCRPCYQDFRLSECHHQRSCLEQISLDEVLSVIKKIV